MNWKYWLVMKSPLVIRCTVQHMFPVWYREHALFYILQDEIQAEINSEIIKTIVMKAKQ